jgi:hypothetical protein
MSTFDTSCRTLASITLVLQSVSNILRRLALASRLLFSQLESPRRLHSFVPPQPTSTRRIRNVQSSSDNSDQSRPAEMVDSLFVRASGCGCRICCDGCPKPSCANRNNGRHRRRCYRSKCSYCVGCVCQVEERRYRQFQFHHNQFTGIVQFCLCATRTLLSLSHRCRISRDYQECNCRTRLQRYGEPAIVDLVADSVG